MLKFFRCCLLGACATVLAACEQANFSFLNDLSPTSVSNVNSIESPQEPPSALDITALTKESRSSVDLDAGFQKAILQAVNQDPRVLSAKSDAAIGRANLRISEAARDTSFKASALGGVEDITDATVGAALVLTADRVFYDGGMLNARIDAEKFSVKAAEHLYETMRGLRAMQLSHGWIDLERYKSLQDLISSRLAVLDPLLLQLKSIATAGVGDISQVASAQRVVSSILVAEIDVSEKYHQAKISFLNDFGRLPLKTIYDASWVSKEVPVTPTRNIIENSPALLAAYWAYRAAEANVVAVEAKDDFNIAFRARLQRPVGGSEKGSDESVGFAISRNFYRGDEHKSQVARAEASAQAKSALVLSGYRQGELAISSARQMIKSFDKGIGLARSNAQSLREEIDYLRKQLIIGGSTLETVLSAEARLYEAESKEISLAAERRKAEVTIVAMSGQMLSALGSK